MTRTTSTLSNLSRRSRRSAPALCRTLTVTGLAVLTPLALIACGSGVSSDSSNTEASENTTTIENCGRELTFDTTPTSIVGMMPSQTELLLRLGKQDSIVGQAQVDTSSLPADVAGEATEIPVLSTNAPPVREDLLAASPDLVVSPTEYEFTAEQGYASIDQLSANGAQAYVATGGCADRRNTAEVGDVFTDITNLGDILGEPNTAEELIADSKARLDRVRDAVNNNDQPTVAQVYVEGNTIGAIGAGVESDIIRHTGGDNVFDPDSPEFEDFFATEINPEEIVDRNPEAIVFGVSGSDQEEQVRTYLRETFPDVPAIQNDVLIAIPQSDLYPGTLGNIEAVEIIARQLYPDAF